MLITSLNLNANRVTSYFQYLWTVSSRPSHSVFYSIGVELFASMAFAKNKRRGVQIETGGCC